VVLSVACLLACLLPQVELPRVGGGGDDDADDDDAMDVDEQQPSGPSSSGRRGRAGAHCLYTAQHTAHEGLACPANREFTFNWCCRLIARGFRHVDDCGYCLQNLTTHGCRRPIRV
jgi:hypothetical protein